MIDDEKMTEKEGPPEVGSTTRDRVVSGVNAVAGLLPGGSLVQAVINEVIPNQRMERVEVFLRFLLNLVDETRLKVALASPHGVDLFEEGLWQSARALTDERKGRIARLVARGLNADERQADEVRHFLRILNHIDDTEILVLMRFRVETEPLESDIAAEFVAKHKDIVEPDQPEEGDEEASRRFHMCYSRRMHLASLGLLRVSGEDWNQSIFGTQFAITPVGTRFLNFVEVRSTG